MHPVPVLMDVPGWAALRSGYRQITVVLSYDTALPYEVQLSFMGTDLVTWQVARELLRTAQRGATGDGDVHMRPEGEYLEVVLQPHEEMSLSVRLRTVDIRLFLECTDFLIPPGGEPAEDVDTEMRRLTGENF